MKLSIRTKTIIMMVVFSFVLIALFIMIYSRVIQNIVEDHFRDYSTSVSATVSKTVDVDLFLQVKEKVNNVYAASDNKVSSENWGSDEWNAYMASYNSIEDDPDFIELRDDIRTIQDVNNVDCIYLVYIDQVDEYFIYVVDGAYEDACPPGCLDIVYDVNKGILKDPTIGFPAYITDTEEYGWLVTSGTPIYKDDEVVGYAMTDISMEEVKNSQYDRILRLIGYLIAATIVIVIFGIIYVTKVLIKPITKLTKAVENYGKVDPMKGSAVFADLNIHSGDELEELANAMKKMESDINENTVKILSLNSRLEVSDTVAHEMAELANTDALTGTRNKQAYNDKTEMIDKMIKEGAAPKFGIVMLDLNNLKIINDSYGHNKGDAALCKLASYAGEVFRHSPVYRIGGDEFVVILQGPDYNNSDLLIGKIKGKFESVPDDESIPIENRISAAVGYTQYDPKKDTCYNDTFERADKLMYEYKRVIKGEN